MKLNDYQSEAHRTQQRPETSGNDLIIPLLGLSGEVGELLNAYKKHLRDGEAHQQFNAQITEELGDILWYLSDVATKFDLTLEEIATKNLQKTVARWGDKEGGLNLLTTPSHIYDANYPPSERFKRQYEVVFKQVEKDGHRVVMAFVGEEQMGQDLTDNSFDADGYRFHDVFHLACVAVLGWSPVSRRNLKCKRRTNPAVDEIEDGGRAIVTEEGISALVFAYASEHNAMEAVKSVDYDLLKAIKVMTAKFEVAVCTTGEWEQAILTGYSVWRQVEKNGGGVVIVDLDQRRISFRPSALKGLDLIR